MHEILGIKMYTLEDIADLLDCSLPCIRAYAKEGRFMTKAIKGKYYVAEENLKRYLLESDPRFDSFTGRDMNKNNNQK